MGISGPQDAGGTVLSYISRAVVKVFVVILPVVSSVAMSKTLAHLPQGLRFLVLGCLRSHGRPGTTLDPAVIDTWTKFTASAVWMRPLTCHLSAGEVCGQPASLQYLCTVGEVVSVKDTEPVVQVWISIVLQNSLVKSWRCLTRVTSPFFFGEVV